MVWAHIPLELLCVAFGMVERQSWDALDQGVDDSGAKLDASTKTLKNKDLPLNLRKSLEISFTLG